MQADLLRIHTFVPLLLASLKTLRMILLWILALLGVLALALERKFTGVPRTSLDASRVRHQPAFFIGVLRNSTKPGSASTRASQALTLA